MPPPYDARCIRVGCLHFSPVFKDVERSIALAGAHLTTLPKDQLDLLVLPEMAFTGYCFDWRSDIEPFLEVPGAGPTFRWASKSGPSLQGYRLCCIVSADADPDLAPLVVSSFDLAIRLGCYVLVGVPERRSHSKASNSPLIVTPQGELFATYRKHFLYETDESWATEGKAFQTYVLPFPPSSSHRGQDFTICPSICMDLNPKGFIAPFDAFELATFARERNVDLVICAMNSLDSNQESLDSEGVLDQATDESEWPRVSDALRYFAVRLTPLLGRGVAFAACNRVGQEKVRFTGSSVLMQLGYRTDIIAYAPKYQTKLIVGVLELPPSTSK
ncbi:BZ3500_MvSof-1268-A1-R1_Chr3-1g05914 [Microbotryum saponariae]|uniref:BZ3500_MvSof-1268-A1-R1_Chr3-1g05914 protein n=1 Tax=Microbotryum saponariae TaxID=289078 RepID=A0A2X0LDR6_9BASI|nr:BZ3500_MvSof-1268-A1-R1_Chr3-1g05914 [Microbotryum saponariae]SDA05104.1 BZ3501_MvSof-1269-A2-R1_Chr3-1g05584 [Microbotryum saponariae]